MKACPAPHSSSLELTSSGLAAQLVRKAARGRAGAILGPEWGPVEAQEGPSWASGAARGPGSEVCTSGEVVQIEPPQGQAGGLEIPSHLPGRNLTSYGTRPLSLTRRPQARPTCIAAQSPPPGPHLNQCCKSRSWKMETPPRAAAERRSGSIVRTQCRGRDNIEGGGEKGGSGRAHTRI